MEAAAGDDKKIAVIKAKFLKTLSSLAKKMNGPEENVFDYFCKNLGNDKEKIEYFKYFFVDLERESRIFLFFNFFILL